jgi:hypothetical protein
MQKLAIAVVLVVISTTLGGTVFRDQIAQAAQLLEVHVTNLDANGNVKVHEQGTAAVHEQGTANVNVVKAGALPVEPAGAPVNICLTNFTIGPDPEPRTYTVPAGKRLVIEYVNAEGLDAGDKDGLSYNYWHLDVATGAGGSYVGDGINARYAFLGQPDDPDANNIGQRYLVSEQVRIYAPAGSVLSFDRRAILDVCMSGYLLDA